MTLRHPVDILCELSCRSFSAKEPWIMGLFCGKWLKKAPSAIHDMWIESCAILRRLCEFDNTNCRRQYGRWLNSHLTILLILYMTVQQYSTWLYCHIHNDVYGKSCPQKTQLCLLRTMKIANWARNWLWIYVYVCVCVCIYTYVHILWIEHRPVLMQFFFSQKTEVTFENGCVENGWEVLRSVENKCWELLRTIVEKCWE